MSGRRSSKSPRKSVSPDERRRSSRSPRTSQSPDERRRSSRSPRTSQSPDERRRSSRSPSTSQSSDPNRRSSSSPSSDKDSENMGFDDIFDSFCKVGDREAEDIALRNVDKWFKQANLFTSELTSTDTAIAFAKIAKSKKKLTKEEFMEMLGELAQEKGMTVEEFQSKLEAAGRPIFSHVTKPIRGSIAADNMERLTNPAGYTGMHRERFDSEGRGLGLAGRYDVVAADGYVQGYRNKDTYKATEEEEEGGSKD